MRRALQDPGLTGETRQRLGESIDALAPALGVQRRQTLCRHIMRRRPRSRDVPEKPSEPPGRYASRPVGPPSRSPARRRKRPGERCSSRAQESRIPLLPPACGCVVGEPGVRWCDLDEEIGHGDRDLSFRPGSRTRRATGIGTGRRRRLGRCPQVHAECLARFSGYAMPAQIGRAHV